MREFKNIHLATVRVECGSYVGTAFFVAKNMLLTAFHVVSDSLNGSATTIFYNGNSYKCSSVTSINGLKDAGLLILDQELDVTPVKLLAMGKIENQPLAMFGYPISRIGAEVGLDYRLRTSSRYKGLSYDKYDSYAERDDHKTVSIFDGFSGSPIFMDDESVIGIVSEELDGHIGYLSIEGISQELSTQGLLVSKDADAHDDSPYGGKRCREFSERTITRLGSRYKGNVHQSDYRLENILSKLKTRSEIGKIRSRIENTWQQIYKDAGNYGFPLTIQNGTVYRELEQLINEWDAKCQSDKKLKGLIYNSLNKLSRDFREYFSYPPNVLVVMGNAGVGKTQQMCHLARTCNHDNSAHVYLLAGTDFNTSSSTTIEEQIAMICKFEDADYLDKLNDKAKDQGKTCFFVIDALNEGLNDKYWEDYLSNFALKISTFSNLALIVTMRSPYDLLYKLRDKDDLRGLVYFYSIIGFADPSQAVHDYFTEYGIDDEVAPEHFLKDGLLLTLFCRLYHSIPYNEKDKLRSRLFLFKRHVADRNNHISKNYIDEDPLRNVTDKYLEQLAKASLSDPSFVIRRDKARCIGNKMLYPTRTWSHSLLYACIQENLLLAGQDETSMDKVETVGFEYEQMEDIYRSIVFLNQKNKSEEKLLNELAELSKKEIKRIDNFISMVTALWPEFFNGEEISDVEGFNAKLLLQQWKNGLKYRKETPPVHLQIDVALKDDKLIAYRMLIASYSDIDEQQLYRYLKDVASMNLHERDLCWTEALNESYDDGDLQYILLPHYFQEICERINTEEWLLHNAIFLSLVCASSYPMVRCMAARRLAELLFKYPQLCVELINLLKGVDDPYILEGMYAAVYGVMLVTTDNKLISEIAKRVYELNFAEKKPMPDLYVREWILRILDKDRAVNNTVLFTKAQPPYISEKPDLSLEIEYDTQDTYFGEEYGSKKLALSLFSGRSLDSDFNRYILGSNSSGTHSTITVNPIDEPVRDAVMFGIRTEECLIADQIKKFGWGDDLGVLDNNRTTPYRSENEIERIGKKYQWLGLRNVEARMLDHFKTVVEYSHWNDHNQQYYNINYPWCSSRHSYFDPTLTIVGSKAKGFVFPVVNFHEEIEDKDWLEIHPRKEDVEQIFIYECNEEKWVLVQSWHVLRANEENQKDCFIFNNSLLVNNADAVKYETWLAKQNFLGRWMPEAGDVYTHLLMEYPWSTLKDFSDNEKVDYSAVELPCEVFFNSYSHLQEHRMGAPEMYGTTESPNIGFMKMYDLRIARTDKIDIIHFLDKDGKVAAWNKTSGDNYGLYVRKDLLDQYLEKNKLSMFYHTISERYLLHRTREKRDGDCAAAKYADGKFSWIMEFTAKSL